MCGALWEKYHHLDGNLLVVPPFTLGSRRPSHGFASYCDKYSLDTNVMPVPISSPYFMSPYKNCYSWGEIAICICKRTFYSSFEN